MSPLGPVLAGTRLLVTAQRRAEDLANALERRGADVRIAAALGVESHIDEEALLEHTRRLIAKPADVVVVTTGVGFRGWLETAEAAGLGEELVAALGRTRLIARGPKARGALQAAGLVPDWVAESETSAEIADFLCTEGVSGQSIAVQHHGAGDDGLESRLSESGAHPFGLVVYRWGPPPDKEAVDQSVRACAAGMFDAVVFTSAPAAAAWLTVVDEADAREPIVRLAKEGKLIMAAVGPVTAEPLRAAGFDPLVPDRGRLGSLVRALILELGDADGGIVTPAGRLRMRASAATLDHAVLPLSPGSLAVLRVLSERPGVVRSREELLRALPGESNDPHTAEVAIARLREAIGSPSIVNTVVKRGYQLIGGQLFGERA